MMGVLNFAHAGFYMLGAYLGYSVNLHFGFWFGLFLAPVLIGCIGVAVERYALRRLHAHGQVSELLFTFGLSYLIVELVQLLWGRAAVPYVIPEVLQGPLFHIFTTQFPIYRGFMMGISLVMFLVVATLVSRTKLGLIIQAALSQPKMVEALGHNVPRIQMWMFGGGCALAGLAGAVGGCAFITEPSMASSIGSIIFVVVVLGGMGSLLGAFYASMLIGILQTFAVTLDVSFLSILNSLGVPIASSSFAYPLMAISIAQMAPILPFLVLVLMLILRPQGLLGNKDHS